MLFPLFAYEEKYWNDGSGDPLSLGGGVDWFGVAVFELDTPRGRSVLSV
jgi:hypothetical protein